MLQTQEPLALEGLVWHIHDARRTQSIGTSHGDECLDLVLRRRIVLQTCSRSRHQTSMQMMKEILLLLLGVEPLDGRDTDRLVEQRVSERERLTKVTQDERRVSVELVLLGVGLRMTQHIGRHIASDHEWSSIVFLMMLHQGSSREARSTTEIEYEASRFLIRSYSS